MLTTNAILAGITTASFAYIGLSLAAVNIKSRAKRVGGIRFLRIGRYQISACRLRAATMRAQSQAELSARAFCEGR